MENQVQLFNHPEFGGVRVIDNNGDVWFIAADICKVLAIQNPTDALKRLDDDEKARLNLGLPGGATNCINEYGAYRLIMGSRKPSAQKFNRWLAHDVVPSIRKTGMYMTAQAAENILLNPDFIIKLAEQVKAAHKERDEFKALAAAKDETIKELEPVAEYAKKILQSPETLCVTVIAKDYGYSGVMFNQLLGSFKIQRRVGKVWVLYQEYLGKGYVVTETVVTKNGGSATQMKWTQKGRRFLYEFLKARGILPLCERQEPMPDLFGGASA